MVGRLFLASILHTHAFPVNRLECGQTQKMNIALVDGSVVLVVLIIYMWEDVSMVFLPL